MSKHYIIMADIVKSSRFEGKGAQLIEQFRDLVVTTNKRFRRKILSPLTITLGDEFQGVPSDLATAIGILIELEELKIRRSVDFSFRYVIHHGMIDTQINRKVAHQMVGSGLTRARKSLESMKSNSRARFQLNLSATDPQRPLEDALTLFFSLVDDWKRRDYELICAFFDGLEYREAAERLGRERTSTLRKFRSLKIREYHACKRLLGHLSGA